ncbi:unnamed protein product [Rotaria sp. Silwood2]|nr:unnamed protein product [Rotaria sp. Silwood2]CAF4264421.1 unnamed protein product [Rotaria sp. Silwood2]
MSQIIAFTNDTQSYTIFYQQLAEEFHRVFFILSAEYYADGMQAAQILTLALPNVVPLNVRDSLLRHLIQDINNKGNHYNLAVELVSLITYPSYGYMFNNPYENVTTMWELWDVPMKGPGMDLRNHNMFTSIGA